MKTRAVNGHSLPPALLTLIEEGRWVAPSQERIALVFGESSTLSEFYPLWQIIEETANWVPETNPAYLGAVDPEVPPGDLDPARSVLIADLGPDRPIALDLRSDPPSVVLLRMAQPPRWRRIAVDVESLAAALGL